MLSIEDQKLFILSQLEKLDISLDLCSVDYLEELAKNIELRLSIENIVNPVEFFKTKSWDSLLRFGLYRSVQFCLTRAIKPQIVVETGVLHGLSSTFFLEAIKLNGHGRLHSIDLPSTFEDGAVNNDGFVDTLPPGLPSGWSIPNQLRVYWSLEIGSSIDQLPKICQMYDEIDIFIHDSEHTYETMMSEFQIVWDNIADGGFLIADNVDTNCSFFDFCNYVSKTPVVFPPDPDHQKLGDPGIRFGLIRK